MGRGVKVKINFVCAQGNQVMDWDIEVKEESNDFVKVFFNPLGPAASTVAITPDETTPTAVPSSLVTNDSNEEGNIEAPVM